ncbi:MAG TPA: response regulator [Anaerolineales bacterium]|nr:response regulator [Anaerolineales bacterium]HNO30866.1 response regulator [Anaerolineales bacterium]
MDDTLGNRELFAMQVREYGLPARHAETGKQAVDILAAEPDAFSLVMMDLSMPDMDGFTATQLIREREKGTGHHVPIIAVTAYAVPGSREMCLGAGMDDFFSKPLMLVDVGDMLAKWLPLGTETESQT